MPEIDPKPTKASESNCDVTMEQTWDDIHQMVTYARATGKSLAGSIRELLAKLCYGEAEPGKWSEESKSSHWHPTSGRT